MSTLKNLALLIFLSFTCTTVLSPFCGLFDDDPELTEEELLKLGPLGRRLRDNFDEEIERIARERDMSKEDVVEILRKLAEMTEEEEIVNSRAPQQYHEPKSRLFIRSLKWVFATFGVSVGLIWIFLYIKLHNNVDDDGQRIALADQLRAFTNRLTGAEARITALETGFITLAKGLREEVIDNEAYRGKIGHGALYHMEAVLNRAERHLPEPEHTGLFQRFFRRRSTPGIFYTEGGHAHDRA